MSATAPFRSKLRRGIPQPCRLSGWPHPRGFDPSPYVRQLKGRGGQTDYLDVKHRLLWLRTEHPDAQIVTELLRLDDQSAVFKATVTIPGGGSATGHGSETVRDFTDYIEKAETKALGRALNALGFGAQFAENDAEEARPSTATGPEQPGIARRPSSPDGREKNDEWTLFWEWARASGFSEKSDIESVIGRSMDGTLCRRAAKLLAPRSRDSPQPPDRMATPPTASLLRPQRRSLLSLVVASGLQATTVATHSGVEGCGGCGCTSLTLCSATADTGVCRCCSANPPLRLAASPCIAFADKSR